ncbi:putative Cytochrome P450 [Seiridium cardinale]
MTFLIAAAAGVLSHVLYFIRGEHHTQAPLIGRLVLAFPVLFVVASYLFGDANYAASLFRACALEFVYGASLLLSVGVYRVFLHRTRRFPGPVLAGATKWYHFFHATNSHQHLFLEDLHQKYGDFVRTGPNEITIFTPDAIPSIHGPESACSKAAWYDNILPVYSIVTLRSKPAHDARRRAWDQGYSIKALQKHEPTILKYAKLLESALSARQGRDLNITEWLEFYGFDVMGAVQYSQSFHMLESGESHWVLDVVKGGTVVMGNMTSLPWLIHLVQSLPFVARGVAKYEGWAAESIRHRMKNKPKRPDTLGWLLKDAQETTSIEDDWNGLIGDTMAMVTGGTEPVIVAIVYLFYYLAQSPERVAKLRAEIRTLTSYSDNIRLQALPYLNALIYETFRLQPGIPSGGLRTTPQEGLVINGTVIPGNTTVLTPHFSLHRREDCFEKPNDFIPERWTTEPQMIKDKRAFMPWGTGPYACIGKNLGLLEIRIVTVLLLDNFDISLAPGEDGKRLHEETLDCFAALPGPLHMVFAKRMPDALIVEESHDVFDEKDAEP